MGELLMALDLPAMLGPAMVTGSNVILMQQHGVCTLMRPCKKQEARCPGWVFSRRLSDVLKNSGKEKITGRKRMSRFGRIWHLRTFPKNILARRTPWFAQFLSTCSGVEPGLRCSTIETWLAQVGCVDGLSSLSFTMRGPFTFV